MNEDGFLNDLEDVDVDVLPDEVEPEVTQRSAVTVLATGNPVIVILT